ncbi:MAG: flagellar export protein FliJ [Phycisphaerae bacterium]|nr:flagellar export protein FliJ [Phycisphaerae bacterium]
MAKGFKFRLDPLLRIRQRAEDERKQAFGKVVGKLNEQTERARRYDESIRQEHRNLRNGHLVGEIDTRHLAHHRLYVNSMMRGLVQTLCERAMTQQESEKARAAMAEAVKGRKVLENLKARRHGEWQTHEDKVEAHLLDEMGVVAHRRPREADAS